MAANLTSVVGADAVASERRTAGTRETTDDVIIYTSGTTGQPKGVVRSHRVLLGSPPPFVGLTTTCR
jgi:long-subunit acyl-CoA synthetase (AMP-forming)